MIGNTQLDEKSPDTDPAPMTQTRAGQRVWTIYRKEFFEIFRDRRTVMSVIVSPLIITPGLFALMGTMITSQSEQAQKRTYKVGLVGAADAPVLMRSLRSAPNLSLRPIEESQAEAEIKSHKLNAVAVLPPDADSRMIAGRAVSIRVLQDAGNEQSQTASARFSAGITAIGQRLLAARLRENHLPPDYAAPFKVTEQPIKSGGNMGSMVLSMMLPYILVIAAFSGAIYASFDQVAGEKERGTLETLLVSPASRLDIVLGKFGAVVSVCLVSSLLSIVGLVFTFSSGLKAFQWLAKGGLHLSPMAVLVTLMVMLPLSVLFAGVLLAVSTFAHNQKEAQTYLAPVFMAVLMPAMASMFLPTDVARTVALVPVLNASIIIKQALSGSYDWIFIGLAFLASAVYAAIALGFATKLFQKESVLIKA
jgi:sodium transport system permease protein